MWQDWRSAQCTQTAMSRCELDRACRGWSEKHGCLAHTLYDL